MKALVYLYFVVFLFIDILKPQIEDTTAVDSVAMETLAPVESYDATGKETKFFGDYYVGIDKVVKDNIRIFGGDLYVAGTVDGKIIVFGGDVNLESTAVINGQVIAIGGMVHKKEGAIVNGKVVEANIKEGITYSEGRGGVVTPESQDFQLDKESFKSRRSWIHPKVKWFIYNRNEGLLLTPFNWQWDRHGKSSFRLNLSLGWRFGQKEPAGKLTLEKAFFPHRNLILFISALRESRTDDLYRLPELENSIASIVARQDFYDRWDEKGVEAGTGIDLNLLKLKLTFRSVELDSISVINNQWSVFHKDRYLRPNLPVLPDNITTYNANLAMRTYNFTPLHSGAGLNIIAEQAVKADILEDYTRIMALAIVNLELSDGIIFRSRLIGGTSWGILPEFRYFSAGGLGSVSAHRYKEQEGNQLLQTNMELVFTPEFIDEDWLIVLFADAGNSWNKSDYSFFDTSDIVKNGISAVGIGVGDEDMDWRVNIAHSLNEDKWETTLRLNFNF